MVGDWKSDFLAIQLSLDLLPPLPSLKVVIELSEDMKSNWWRETSLNISERAMAARSEPIALLAELALTTREHAWRLIWHLWESEKVMQPRVCHSVGDINSARSSRPPERKFIEAADREMVSLIIWLCQSFHNLSSVRESLVTALSGNGNQRWLWFENVLKYFGGKS